MEMSYRERWRAEIAELQRILSGLDLTEERKWGKPCYTTALAEPQDLVSYGPQVGAGVVHAVTGWSAA
jgi:hypothetical protein